VSPLISPAAAATGTPPRSRRRPAERLWDQATIYLPVLLMGLLALASYWLLRATPDALAPAVERPVTHEPDYFMRRFSVKLFDATGQLTHEVFGAEARHRPDTDEIEIDQARIRSIQQGGLLTTATARQVTTNGQQTEFLLQGDAVVIREGGRTPEGTVVPRVEFRGEELRVITEPQRVLSSQPVTLVRGNNRLNADTLDYQGEDGVAVFQGRVRARLAP
jgi:lipopolysaccharide export system protein LptC